MQINNRIAIRKIVDAIQDGKFDCADWSKETLEEFATELLASLAAEGFFLVKLI